MRHPIEAKSLRAILEPEKAWLSSHPPFQDSWQEGESWIAEELLHIVQNDWRLLDEADPKEEALACCFGKAVHAVLFHWKEKVDCKNSNELLAVDGNSIINDLRMAVRPKTQKGMGGDPIRDVVFAEAAVRMKNRALQKFYDEYKTVFWNEVRRRKLLQVDVDDWDELFKRLVGANSPQTRSGKLLKFKGLSSLNVWLRPVIHRFVIDQFRRSQTRKRYEGAKMSTVTRNQTPQSIVESKESRQILSTYVSQAFERLDAREQSLLHARVVLGKRNKEIAEGAALNKGVVSRRIKKTISRFCEEVRNIARASQKDAEEFLNAGDDELFEFCALNLSDLFAPQKGRRLKVSGTIEATTAPMSVVPKKVDTRIAHLIPDKTKIRSVCVSENAFEVFKSEQEIRSLFICVDARIDEPKVGAWLEEFQRNLDEQYVNSEGNFVDPRLIVVVNSEETKDALVAEWPSHYIMVSTGDDVREEFVTQIAQSLSVAFAASSDEPEPIGKNAIETIDVV